MMRVPLLDLRRQYQSLKSEILAEFETLAESQSWILGSVVEQLEGAVTRYCGGGHAIGVSSGTDAELALLMALGVGAGDAIITSPYSFFATAGCITRVGARPVFADIDALTFNVSPASVEGALHRHKRIKAIIPVHLFGQCADMEKIVALARAHDLSVLEDAAQAIGARHPLGSAATIGEAGWFSFYPTKNLGAFGDAGMIICKDAELADRLKALRNHGMETRYHHKWVGGNFRLDAIQAAVLKVKLQHLERWNIARRERADFYRAEFARLGLSDAVKVPHAEFAQLPDHHVYNQFVIRVSERDALRRHLQANGVGTEVYYPVPLHLQECFQHLGYRVGDFPVAERAATETLALPIFPEIRPEEQSYVVEQIASFFS